MDAHSRTGRRATPPRDPCARASRARGEDTAGTLGHFDLGMFVEGTAPFPRLALASLSPELHAFNLETWRRYQETGVGPHPRILPIRRDRQRQGDSLVVFFCVPTPGGRPLQLRYDVADHGALTDFDLTAIRNRPHDFAAHRDDAFRVLVCTHGKVDPCCAVDGNRLYRHLRDRGDVEVWHAAHFGGCRFAPNLWCLPSGNCYGRVSTATVDALIDAERRRQVFPKGYRGRIGQSMTTAAAEFLARQRHDAWGLDELRVEASPAIDGRVTVYAAGEAHGYRLASEPHPDVFFTTCRAEEPRSPPVYRLEPLDEGAAKALTGAYA